MPLTNSLQLRLHIEIYNCTLKVGIKICILSSRDKKCTFVGKILYNLKGYMNPNIPD